MAYSITVRHLQYFKMHTYDRGTRHLDEYTREMSITEGYCLFENSMSYCSFEYIIAGCSHVAFYSFLGGKDIGRLLTPIVVAD